MKYVACALLCSLSGVETNADMIKHVLEASGIDYDMERIENVLNAIREVGGVDKARQRGFDKMREYAEIQEVQRIMSLDASLKCGCDEIDCHICWHTCNSSDEEESSYEEDFGLNIF
jgi:hypothetical protein